MKVLSLLQPWATLVVTGAKRIETRSFNTKHRGPLLIHASGKPTARLREIAGEHPFCDVLPPGKRIVRRGNRIDVSRDYLQHLPFGAIIGMVNVVDTFHTEDADCWIRSNAIDKLNAGRRLSERLSEEEMAEPLQRMLEQERAFGDYSADRYGWLLSDPVLFPEPIPCKGAQMLWKYDGPLPEIVQPAKSIL